VQNVLETKPCEVIEKLGVDGGKLIKKKGRDTVKH